MSDVPPRSRLRLSTVSALYLGVLAVVLVCLHWWAEHFLPVWVLLFAPPAVLLIPMAILAVCAVVRRRWKLLLVFAACTAVVLFVFYPFRISRSTTAQHAFTVVTHNIGQGNKQAFSEAFPGESADVILLQDANYGEKAYAQRYPNLRMRRIEQFLLLTPHEIIEATPVNDALWRGKPVAARFVVRANGRDAAFYNVHLPTPRRSLRHAFSPRVALEMLWISDAPTDDHPSYRSWLRGRITLAEELATVFERETLPFIVAGDLNTPEHGTVYRQFSSRLRDAHAAAGVGWGYTFPADARKDGLLARVFGAWLRLDYVFAGRGFTPVECRVASDERSQHRAVLARLAPVP
jgi:vancomycin resistance protein VanJ